MTDPIADMLSRIRNAIQAKKSFVELPFSKTKFAIAKILERERLVDSVEKIETKFGTLRVELKYANDGSPIIRQIRRISTPGHRVYVGKTSMPVVLSGFGLAIVSTSSGIMTSKDARKKGLGGEVMCEVF